MASLETLLPGFLPFVPDCPDITATFWLREAAISFCERTEAWRQRLVVSVDATGFVDLSGLVPADSALVSILNASLDGRQLEPETESVLDSDYDGWRTGGLVGTPELFGQTTFDNLVIVPATGATQQIAIVMALKPQIDSANVPDFIVNHYKDIVMLGARSRLLGIPNKPWSNQNLALALESEFDMKCNSARGNIKQGQQKGHKRTKARFF